MEIGLPNPYMKGNELSGAQIKLRRRQKRCKEPKLSAAGRPPQGCPCIVPEQGAVWVNFAGYHEPKKVDHYNLSGLCNSGNLLNLGGLNS